MQETWLQSLGQEYPLEKEMATHSSILAREIPWVEEPGRLQSMGSQKSRTRLSSNNLNRCLHISVQKQHFFFCNFQKETTEGYINKCVDKQNVIYTYNGISYSYKKFLVHATTWLNFECIYAK